jgi:hypothetical protein
MNNLRHALVLAMAAGLLSLPWACSKGFGVSPTSPGPSGPTTATATATSTYVFSPTKTPTANPSFTSTNTPTITATPTPFLTPTSTPTLVDINLTSGVTVLPGGLYNFGCVHIGSGAAVTIEGAVTVFCTCFTLDAGATITGVGTGSEGCPSCPRVANGMSGAQGAGSDSGNGNCGALCTGGGHGGAGSHYCYYNGASVSCCADTGGVANDDPVHPAFVGAPGGWPADSYPFAGCLSFTSNGGGLLQLVVYDPTSNVLRPAVINGNIDMSGVGGAGVGEDAEPSGAGAGGTILIEASIISGTGTLNAIGGGQSLFGDPSPGGGGGIISLIADTSGFSGTTSIVGGPAWNLGLINYPPGQSGVVTITAPPSSGY